MRRSLLLAVLALTAFVNAHASIFTETVDAGDFLNPQSVVGSGITAIHGEVGGAEDPVDAFRFWFAGGDLGVKAESWLCGGTAWSNNDPLCRGNLSIGLVKVDPFEPVDPCQPGDPCYDPGLLVFSTLTASNYVVGVCQPVDPCLTDPPFTLSFINPTTGGSAQIIAPVPEPGSVALLGLGLAGLAAARRRRGRR